MTHQANFALPKQGYTHWWKMFNPRQLLVHASLLRSISVLKDTRLDVREQGLGAIQQYLRNQNGFVFWNPQRDTPEPFFSNPNYAPKLQFVENCVFGKLGRGNWTSAVEGIQEGLDWCRQPWEVASPQSREATGESRIALDDSVRPGATLVCASSSELPESFSASFDLVVTDPPFGDNIFYSDLSNFFHAWLRIPLRHNFPELFEPLKTPNSQEALAPRAMLAEDANGGA